MKNISITIFTLLTIFAFLFTPVKALAHAHLLKEQPAENTQSKPINRIILKFSEPIEPLLSKISVTGANKTLFSLKKIEVSKDDANKVIIPLKTTLSKGVYEVNWKIISKDGHKTSGQYQFTIK